MQTNTMYGLQLKEQQTAKAYFTYRNYCICECIHFLNQFKNNTIKFRTLKKIFYIHRCASLSAINSLIFHSYEIIEELLAEENQGLNNHYKNKIKVLVANAILSKDFGVGSYQ